MMKTIKNVMGVLLLAGLLVSTGCTHRISPEAASNTAVKSNQEVSALQNQLKQKNQEIAALASKNQSKDMLLEKYKAKLDDKSKAALEADMKSKSVVTAGSAAAGAMLLPPQAKTGECYARVFIPPTFKTMTEKVLKRAPSERLEIEPATYGMAEKRILVKEASERLELVPAQYGWAEEKVLVKEASTRIEKVPAKYEWKTEKILVKPAYSMWKKGRGPIEKIGNATGEIMCLVEVPAVYKTVKKKVMVSPPTVRTINIPAEYKTVKKKVMIKPPTTHKVVIPAVYKTVKVKTLVTAPKERRITIPPEYQTVTKTEKVTEGHMEWRRILCETNTSADLVAKVQRALKNAGQNPGEIDGVFGWRTINAMKAYQKKKGLAVGALTYETIKSLGVRF